MKKNKPFYIVISILISVCLWLYVDNVDQTPATTTVSNIPIEFIGESDALAARGLMMVQAQSTSVTLELQGQRNVISKLRKKDIRVQVDLSTITSAGTQSLVYSVLYPDSISQSSVTVKSASISRVTVEIGPLYTKTIEIHGTLEGTVASGYSAGEFTIDPQTLQVSGKESDVLQVAYARVTMQLDEARETTTRILPVELVNYSNEVITGLDLRLDHENVSVTLPIVTIKELPLQLTLLERPGSTRDLIDYNIDPASITVSGDAASLSTMEYIMLATIDLSQVMADETRTYSIPLPADSTNLSGTTEATVTIRFKNVETRTLTVTQISTSNLASGYVASVTSRSVAVTLRGPAQELENLTEDHVRIVADLSEIGRATGSYTVPATVYVDGHEQVGAIGNYEITVRITGGRS